MITDEELMDIARPLAEGGRWPSDWIYAMRAAIALERAENKNIISALQERADYAERRVLEFAREVGARKEFTVDSLTTELLMKYARSFREGADEDSNLYTFDRDQIKDMIDEIKNK